MRGARHRMSPMVQSSLPLACFLSQVFSPAHLICLTPLWAARPLCSHPPRPPPPATDRKSAASDWAQDLLILFSRNVRATPGSGSFGMLGQGGIAAICSYGTRKIGKIGAGALFDSAPRGLAGIRRHSSSAATPSCPRREPAPRIAPSSSHCAASDISRTTPHVTCKNKATLRSPLLGPSAQLT